MEGVTLYRKYRPMKWADVLEQEHVVKVLRGALKEGNVGHAYLFAGPRGTGKTSVARILAREVGTTAKDLYEIDAASNRGIDDVRELREAVSVMPFDSKYKVYIVDEVHMLTKEAFNALLKTLEEPPAHVIFILATTEVERLPDTIVSRCEVHHFKQPSRTALKKHVADIAKREGFTLESASSELIALLAEGSFRDAQGILQKIIVSSKDKKVSVGEVEMVTGAPRGELVNRVVRAIDTRAIDGGLDAIAEAVAGNVERGVFAKLLLEKLRAVLLLRFAKGMRATLAEDFSEEDFAFLEDVAGNGSSGVSAEALATMLEAYTQIGYSYIPQLPLELALIKLTNDQRQTTNDEE